MSNVISISRRRDCAKSALEAYGEIAAIELNFQYLHRCRATGNESGEVYETAYLEGYLKGLRVAVGNNAAAKDDIDFLINILHCHWADV